MVPAGRVLPQRCNWVGHPSSSCCIASGKSSETVRSRNLFRRFLRFRGSQRTNCPLSAFVAQVKPIVDFAPVLGTPCDGCSGFPPIHAPDHNIHAIQSSFGVQPFRNSLPIEAPEQIQTVGENHRFIEANFRLTEGLTHAICRRNELGIEQSDVEAFRMSVSQECLMQVRQSCRDCASISAASNNQAPALDASAIPDEGGAIP